jgi:hypothetical protein
MDGCQFGYKKKKSLKKKKTHLYMDGCNFSCKNKFLTKCSCRTPQKNDNA